jgi:RNA polymerase sigma factor (sigma-70 family)
MCERLERRALGVTDPVPRLILVLMPEGRGSPVHVSDAELLRASRRDDHAFRRVYDRRAAHVFRFLEARCDERETALDLTAEVFARAWLHRGRFRDEAGGSALPWLLGIARNVLRASLEQRRIETEARRRLGLEYREVTVEPDAGWLIDSEGEIQAALTRLPAAERDAIALRVVESLSYRDVASRLDCSEAAARVRVHRGLSRLRAILQEAVI